MRTARLLTVCRGGVCPGGCLPPPTRGHSEPILPVSVNFDGDGNGDGTCKWTLRNYILIGGTQTHDPTQYSLVTCRDHTSMMGMLSRIIQDGFDLSGVRLLYPTSDLMKMTEGAAGRNARTPPIDKSRQLEVLNNIGKVTEAKVCSHVTFFFLPMSVINTHIFSIVPMVTVWITDSVGLSI